MQQRRSERRCKWQAAAKQCNGAAAFWSALGQSVIIPHRAARACTAGQSHAEAGAYESDRVLLPWRSGGGLDPVEKEKTASQNRTLGADHAGTPLALADPGGRRSTAASRVLERPPVPAWCQGFILERQGGFPAHDNN